MKSSQSTKPRTLAVFFLGMLMALAILTAGCSTIPDLPADPGTRQSFSSRRESEDGSVVSWSGYQDGYQAGEQVTLDLTLENQTEQPWKGRFCLLLMEGSSPSVAARLDQRGFLLDSGLDLSDTLKVTLPDNLEDGFYGLSLAVRRPGGPMVDVVPISVGQPEGNAPAVSQAQVDAALEACETVDDREQLIERAKADLAGRLTAAPEAIQVQSVKPTQFNDASLGVPEEGKTYAQVLTPGYIISLRVGQQIYRYHGGSNRVVFVADSSSDESGSAEPPGSTVPLAQELPRNGQISALPVHFLIHVEEPENLYTVSLRWEDGTELSDTFTALAGPGGIGYLVNSLDWQTESQPPQPPTQKAVLMVESSSGDLVVEKKITVIGTGDPILETVDLYWLLGEQLETEQRPVVGTGSLEAKAVEELLWGPAPRNLAGFQTAIPTPDEILTYPGRQPDWGVRVQLLGFTLEGGTATVNLSRELKAYGGGSARVQAIREQITRTLKEFSSVDKVVIAVNGSTEGVLQP